MYKNNGVWFLKTAQTFGFLIAGNVMISIFKEDCTVNVVRYGSNILQ
jgi:hypothetical protein